MRQAFSVLLWIVYLALMLWIAWGESALTSLLVAAVVILISTIGFRWILDAYKSAQSGL